MKKIIFTLLVSIGILNAQTTVLPGKSGGTGIVNTGKTLTMGSSILWPVDASGVLTNNGSGTLTWAASLSNALTNGYIFIGNGSNIATGVLPTLSATPGTFTFSNTGVLTLPNATTALRGLLSSTDWNTFNGKQSALGFTPEDVANKATDLSSNDNTHYPSTAAVQTAINNAVSGQDYKEACKYASTAALPTVIYSNGSSGVGATLTGAVVGAISIDGSSPIVGNRILIKNQVSTFQNGIYTITATGSGIAVFILTRTTDFDQASEILTGDATFVTSGSTQSATTWVVTSDDNPVMGTDAITFVQTSGQGSLIAGTGINITGTTITASVVPNASLQNSSTTINGTTISLGASGTVTAAASTLTGTLVASSFPQLTGDITTPGNSLATTLATVNSNTGSFGGSTAIPVPVVNAKGLITAMTTSVVVAPAGTLTGATLASGVTASSLTSFGSSPTLTTPNIGVATAASINKVVVTAPATSSTLTVANGKSLTVSNSLTFTGTDATSFGFPSTGGTVQTLTATQTVTNKDLTSTTNTFPFTPYQPIYSGKYRTFPFVGTTNTATGWTGNIFFVPYYINQTHTVTAIDIEVTTAATGSLVVGLYSDSAGLPNTLIEGSGNLATAGTVTLGNKEYTFASPIVLSASSKMVWMAFQVSAAAVGLRYALASQLVQLQYLLGTGNTTVGTVVKTQAYTQTMTVNPKPTSYSAGSGVHFLSLKIQ